MSIAPGERFAGYTVVRLLGAGGMGEVYLAAHPRLPRQDAIKVLRKDVSADTEYQARFEREADFAADLMHPNIVRVYDRGEYDGQLWISMEYVDGTDAGQLLRGRGSGGLPADEVVHIVSAVADALDYAHQRKLLHRDIKPANILLTDIGAEWPRVLLADFGIARRMGDTSRLTATSMTVGTVAYAAPEQLMGEHVDGRADQYSLAATAFELLAGVPPYLHDNPAAVISKHITAPPPPIAGRRPELADLDPVLSRALAKSPEDRFGSCAEFASALRASIGGPGGLTVPAQAYRTPKPRRRRTRLLALVAVLATIGVAAAAYLLGEREPVTRHAAPGTPPVPVVLIGADCETLGAAGQSSTGEKAYCARLPSTGDTMWSIYSGTVPVPTVTPAATDQVYPPGIEAQVRVCVTETGQDRATCRDNVRRGNLVGPP
ncbi:serine/threonine protein kinase [Mycobacterium hackensackense]|uniref:serine/threonine-protein kinase n=1 Tax=Mycobacterium hackensackense TaxID=228909 RepID=UPI002265A248|nr:serine/threonine-protein kinase [Mycobacterium hackensackense]MCV7253165.1 serine/threonine protein kinase [Mycobacterium hackensackense]